MLANRTGIPQLFRGRPYTKAMPFQFILTGVTGATHTIWAPVGAFFELALVICKSTVPMDLILADTIFSNVIGFLGPDGTNSYGPGTLDLGQAGFRSLSPTQPRLLLIDGGVAGTVKGVAYGWEVTLDGNYR